MTKHTSKNWITSKTVGDHGSGSVPVAHTSKADTQGNTDTNGVGSGLATSELAQGTHTTKSLTHTRLCGHPELRPMQYGETKPAPAFMVGCIHNHSCPVCGFGQGLHPHSQWDCPDRLGEVTDLLATDSEPSIGNSDAPIPTPNTMPTNQSTNK